MDHHLRFIEDYQGKRIRLTDERLAYILEHPEMRTLEPQIAETLKHPETVVQSLVDPQADLYYRFYLGTPVGDKFLCVVVKYRGDDAFVLTAYLTDKQKQGEEGMADKKVKIWYDTEGDFLEVSFEQKAGYFRETASEHVMEKVDDRGNIIGFSVLKVSALKEHSLEVAL